MHRDFGIDLPRLHSGVLFWRIGELLSLPYAYRVKLDKLCHPFKMDFVLVIHHEKHPSNPLILAFSLTIFYLKLHYGLLDQDYKFVNETFGKLKLPTLLELRKHWQRTISALRSPFTNQDIFDFDSHLKFFKQNIVPQLGSDENCTETELSTISSYLQQIDPLINLIPESRLSTTEQARWLNLNDKIDGCTSSFWAMNYICLTEFEGSSEIMKELLEIGANFCSCSPVTLYNSLTKIFESRTSYESNKGIFL
jgi:hypothetical protein